MSLTTPTRTVAPWNEDVTRGWIIEGKPQSKRHPSSSSPRSCRQEIWPVRPAAVHLCFFDRSCQAKSLETVPIQLRVLQRTARDHSLPLRVRLVHDLDRALHTEPGD